MIGFKEYLSEAKGLHVFDIDETLMKTNAKIHVKDKSGKHVTSLDNQQFNDHKLHPDHHYDFSEFRDAKKFHDESTPIHPMIRKVKAIQRNIKAGGHKSKVIMSTARADFDDKKPVLDKFKKHGIDMDSIHLHRAGNIEGNHKPAEKKNVILRKHLDTGNYDHVHFYDDSKTNLDHFHKLRAEYPHIKFHAHHVDHDGKTKKHEVKESWQRASMRKHGSVKPGYWHPEQKRFIQDMTNADKPETGWTHDRLVGINAEVEVGGKTVAGKRTVTESLAKQVAVALIALKAGVPHHQVVSPAGESEDWTIPSKAAMVPKRIARMRKHIKVPTIKAKP
jgi:hypothetical protein